MAVVLMTSAPREGRNEAARGAGVQGTVVKAAEIGGLLGTLRAVANGKRTLRAPHSPAPRRVQLSTREREIVQLGPRVSRTSRSPTASASGRETVKTILYRAFEKLGAHRRSEAVAQAQRRGLLDKPPGFDS